MVIYDQIQFSTKKLIKEITMRVVKLLHNQLKKALPNIHSKRLYRLVETSSSLLRTATLSIASLGRHSKGSSQVKNKIKAVDRLVGNGHLHSEHLDIYQTQAALIIGAMKKIDILVDWSSVGSHENHMLRASLALEGRSMTLYQEVHPEKKLGTYKVHKQFLSNLKKLLPAHCEPLIITDAGFRTEWFELVSQNGWDFEGRHLSNMKYRLEGRQEWENCCELYKKATKIPKYIGKIVLSKNRELSCELYLYSDKKDRKKKINKKRKITSGKGDKQYRKNTKTPWLLITSKPHKKDSAKKVVRKYSRRMKVEHDFRDTKDPKWGIGLRYTRTRDIRRLEVLLLIGSLALLMLWLIGLAAEMKRLHYQFQANTIKNRRVLSLIFLGKQVVEHALHKIKITDILNTMQIVRKAEEEFLKGSAT